MNIYTHTQKYIHNIKIILILHRCIYCMNYLVSTSNRKFKSLKNQIRINKKKLNIRIIFNSTKKTKRIRKYTYIFKHLK